MNQETAMLLNLAMGLVMTHRAAVPPQTVMLPPQPQQVYSQSYGMPQQSPQYQQQLNSQYYQQQAQQRPYVSSPYYYQSQVPQYVYSNGRTLYPVGYVNSDASMYGR